MIILQDHILFHIQSDINHYLISIWLVNLVWMHTVPSPVVSYTCMPLSYQDSVLEPHVRPSQSPQTWEGRESASLESPTFTPRTQTGKFPATSQIPPCLTVEESRVSCRVQHARHGGDPPTQVACRQILRLIWRRRKRQQLGNMADQRLRTPGRPCEENPQLSYINQGRPTICS